MSDPYSMLRDQHEQVCSQLHEVKALREQIGDLAALLAEARSIAIEIKNAYEDAAIDQPDDDRRRHQFLRDLEGRHDWLFD